jgi:phosphoserine phosphatase
VLRALSAITPTPGAPETLAALQAAGVRLAILSGSLDLVLEHFYAEVPFVEVLINRLHFDETGRLSGGVHTPYDVEQKGAGVHEIARRQGVPLARLAFVGDNYNDVSAAREAGLAIAFNPRSSELAAQAHVVVTEPDLRALLPYLLPTLAP